MELFHVRCLVHFPKQTFQAGLFCRSLFLHHSNDPAYCKRRLITAQAGMVSTAPRSVRR